jgi:XRE family transcriptional regulator, regulator of sulfur utilization
MSGGEPAEGRQVAAAFGSVLRAVRQEAGVTQEDLAFRADVDRTYPSLLERGRRQPTLAIVLRVARALTMEPAELVNRTIARLRERGVRV